MDDAPRKERGVIDLKPREAVDEVGYEEWCGINECNSCFVVSVAYVFQDTSSDCTSRLCFSRALRRMGISQ